MKKYLLFSSNQFYPYGGWNDFQGDFKTKKEAKKQWNKIKENFDWGHIVNTKNGEMKHLRKEDENE